MVINQHFIPGQYYHLVTATWIKKKKKKRQCLWVHWGFPSGSVVKNLPAMQKTQVQVLRWEDLLEKGMATHSRQPIPTWEISWTEEPSRLPSMGSLKSRTSNQKTTKVHWVRRTWALSKLNSILIREPKKQSSLNVIRELRVKIQREVR